VTKSKANVCVIPLITEQLTVRQLYLQRSLREFRLSSTSSTITVSKLAGEQIVHGRSCSVLGGRCRTADWPPFSVRLRLH